MAQINVGIGELAVSDRRGDSLMTFSLGSCVAVMVTHRSGGVAGMAHIVLPKATNEADIERKPDGYFADVAIKKLMARLFTLGTSPASGAVVRIAGGASTGKTSRFDVGRRNIESVRTELLRARMRPIAEEVGGSVPRTVRVEVQSGRVWVSLPDGSEKEL